MADLSLPGPVHVFAQVPPRGGDGLTSRASQTRCSVALKPKMMLNSKLVPVSY